MSEFLKPTGTDGDFVHNSQNMSKDDGFACVSGLWFDQTIAITDGIEQIVDDARGREDLKVKLKDMDFRVNDDGEIVLEYVDGREFAPTSHAWNQICNWCYTPRTFFNEYSSQVKEVNGKVAFKRDDKDIEILNLVLRNGRRHRLDQIKDKEDKTFLFRTYNDGTVRAMLSDIYGIIDNGWYLNTVKELFTEVGKAEPRLSHWRGNADTIYGNILIPDSFITDSDGDYGAMISASNCEIGIRTLSQFPSVFRAICMNGCIWDQSKGWVVNKRHRGEINLNELRLLLLDNIKAQLPVATDAIKKFLETKTKVLDKGVGAAHIMAAIALDYRLTTGLKGEAMKALEAFDAHESANKNLFGILNGITRAGQTFDNQEWIRLDEVGGQLMNVTANKWESLNKRALSLDKKDMEKVYGVAI